MLLTFSVMSMFCSLIISFIGFFDLVRGYDLVRDYSGTTFFDGWDFYGSWDNLTLGDVWWLDADQAFDQRLAYINDAGHAIMKVDNASNVPFNEKRNSIRITSKDAYAVGSLWIIDALHLPFGCSVWPAFWTFGPDWPVNGEIDIIEGINLQFDNQPALHSLPGCTQAQNPGQTGITLGSDCSTPEGCLVRESHPNSYQSGFAAVGGGVWATQFDVAGIYIWFWSRPDVPASILAATSEAGSSIDVSQWGPPSASFPASSCNIPQFFSSQNLVFDITLCGVLAGVPSIYGPVCGSQGPTGLCYNDMVVGDGSKFSDAYFEVSYVRAYTTPAVAPSITPAGGLSDDGGGAPLTTTITGQSTTTTVTYQSRPAITPPGTGTNALNAVTHSSTYSALTIFIVLCSGFALLR
ncbi:concanavalin A-like lectin/glucanase domain-containing protein [Mycena floridula]|nr:concanavalin A-like lectin/glucanase domain-containing protein [Mycena floridula]